MLAPAKSRAENLYVMEMEKTGQEPAENMARLKALRLTKEAADKKAAAQVAVLKEAIKKVAKKKKTTRKKKAAA